VSVPRSGAKGPESGPQESTEIVGLAANSAAAETNEAAKIASARCPDEQDIINSHQANTEGML